MQKKCLLLLCAGVLVSTSALYAMEDDAREQDGAVSIDGSENKPRNTRVLKRKNKAAASASVTISPRKTPRPPQQPRRTKSYAAAASPASSTASLSEAEEQQPSITFDVDALPAFCSDDLPTLASYIPAPQSLLVEAPADADTTAPELVVQSPAPEATQTPEAAIQVPDANVQPAAPATGEANVPEQAAPQIADQAPETNAQLAVVASAPIEAQPAPEAANASVNAEYPGKSYEGLRTQDDGLPVWYTWFGANRGQRVEYALTRKHKDKKAADYLASQDGRHEIGRELNRATQELAAEGLTPATANLVKLMTILNMSKKHGVSINLADLQLAHAKIKAVKTEATQNLNKKLSGYLAQFLANINQEFKAETDLIACLALLQHTTAQMRRDLNNDPENESDNEDAPKAWDMAQVFEELNGINTPHKETILGVEISLNEPMEEIN